MLSGNFCPSLHHYMQPVDCHISRMLRPRPRWPAGRQATDEALQLGRPTMYRVLNGYNRGDRVYVVEFAVVV